MTRTGTLLISAMTTLAMASASHAVVTGVVPGDSANMSLHMYNGALQSQSINMGGQVMVTRGAFTDLGQNRNGIGRVQGYWDEVVQGSSVFVNVIFRSSNGEQFMPPGSTVNAQPAFFWTWNFGTTNGVDFMPWVTNVSLVSAHAHFSRNGGTSFFASSNISGNTTESWNPGRDPGEIQATIGDGTNYILMRYEINVIPAPASLALLAGGALALGRRRR